MIGVVDYGIGNLHSAQKALRHVGGEAELISSPDSIADADALVLPGVGSFGRCADALSSAGWTEPLLAAISSGVPFLGICVGFQLLYEGSAESPDAVGLSVLKGSCRRLPSDQRCPQIQWNRIDCISGSTLLPEPLSEEWMYFVHSYAPPVGGETVATCSYGETIAAAIEKENLFGAQFHPEKSGDAGLRYLRRFVDVVECQ
jgi:glutamine amidotransferase